MDFVSHILVGRALAAYPKHSRREMMRIIFASCAPDIPQILLYAFVGFQSHRFFFVPFLSDWDGVRAAHPVWSMLWEIPHSIFFFALIAVPGMLFFKWPKMAFVAYASHIFLDLFTHFGEWAVRPLYPFFGAFQGITNAWAWSIESMLLSWALLLGVIFALDRITRKSSNLQGFISHTIHSRRIKKILDYVVYAGGVLIPLVTLPQLLKIWIERQAAGVSVFSWSAYAVGSLFWMLYGAAHREKPIVFCYALLFVLELFIIAGALVYG